MGVLYKIFIAIFLFLEVSFILNAGEFYAILVGDTSDKTISVGVRENIRAMEEEIENMAKFSGQHLQLKIFQGRSATLEDIADYAVHLEVGPDDVIVFYQSSHGFRTTSHEGIWPLLFYGRQNEAISFESVYHFLLEKKPRFLLCIADVCNNVLDEMTFTDSESEVQKRAKRSRESTSKNRHRCYQNLFLKSKGAIIATGSRSGQMSYYIVKTRSSTPLGGIFTMSFLKALKEASEGKIISDWDRILKLTSQQTKKEAKTLDIIQTPQYEVHLYTRNL